MTGGKPFVDPLPDEGHHGQDGKGGECPFCGANLVTPLSYNCWTVITKADPGQNPEYHRGHLCYNRQIAQLQESLGAWREYAKALEGVMDQTMMPEELERLVNCEKRIKELKQDPVVCS